VAVQPLEINLDIRPNRRFEIIDVSALLCDQVGDALHPFRKAVYCSFHTTAGYLEQGVCRHLGHSRKQLDPFIRAVQKIFPHDAGYFHDRMQLRDELSDSQKEKEPVNADSHLTFIGAGLKNCVTYLHRPDEPVYFIELDGIYKDYVRDRRTTVMAYDRAEIVHRGRIAIPVEGDHAIDSFNLKDARYGLFEQLEEWSRQYGVDKGCIDIRLAPEEEHVGMTVNEYETLLMRNDLPEVLSDPLRYVLKRSKKLLQHPAAIPGKTRDYAAYDLIHFYNDLMDQVPVGRSVIDRIFSVLSTPAKRILRLKRRISLLVSDSAETGPGHIVHGTYQSPILVQHHPAEDGVRYMDITLRRFT
tara:strand:+ start:147 stop:1217 length:1071 start_codon:yes stop_codon:yes gene_type:complete